jgi:TrpR-related protein YerC/YecD
VHIGQNPHSGTLSLLVARSGTKLEKTSLSTDGSKVPECGHVQYALSTFLVGALQLLVVFLFQGGADVNKKLDNEAVNLFFDAVLSLENKEQCFDFFEDVCTINEILSFSQRFEVAKMLREGKTYLEIAQLTGASTATISRVNRSLNYGNESYDRVFEKLGVQKGEPAGQE